MTILGLSIGGRTTGLAIIKDGELLESRTLTLRNKMSEHYSSALNGYVRQYKITNVVIKTPPKTHMSDRIRELLARCLEIFSYHGCMVDTSETKAIRAVFPNARNKGELMRLTASSYPDLSPLLEHKASNGQGYHTKMLEAVMVAHLKRNSANELE